MIPRKLIFLCLPLAIAGGWGVVGSTLRISQVEQEIADLAQQGSAEGESFRRTFNSAHTARQVLTFDKRRELARALGDAHRNRFLGLFAIVLSVLVALGGAVFRRLAAEVNEDRAAIED